MKKRTKAPGVAAWIIALIIGIVGIIAHFSAMGALSTYAFWLVTVAFVLLILATVIKGL